MRRLVDQVLAGRAGAWQGLVAALEPHIEQIAGGSRSMGPLRDSDDHRRNVVADVLAKLARNEYRALALLEHWLTANPEKSAGDWLRIVVTNVVRAYVSTQLGGAAPADSADRDDPLAARKRLLHTLASALPDDDLGPSQRPPVTDQQTARQVLDYAAQHLGPEQLAALEGWLRHGDFERIGRDAGADGDAARSGEKLVRAALARLRRHFAAE
jgi:hypothetical protein